MTNLTPFDLSRAKAGDKVTFGDSNDVRINGNVTGFLFGSDKPKSTDTIAYKTDKGLVIVCYATGKPLIYGSPTLVMDEPAVPEGYIRHDGGACPVDPETVESVFVKEKYGDAEYVYPQPVLLDWKHKGNGYDVIAYKLKPVPEPSVGDVIERLGKVISFDPMGRDEEANKALLRQFADLIIKEARR